MFKNEFQGSHNFFEIFNPSAKDALVNFKLTGSNGIQKIYDKDVKGSVYQLDGNPATTKLSIPKDTRSGLSLVQRYIVFQVNIKENNEFSMEIGISDLSQNRRNLSFSTLNKELNVQPLNAKIPMKYLNRSWTNLVFDLTTLINDLWKNQTLKSIETFSISANCKIRKIFTLNTLPNSLSSSSEVLSSVVDFPKSTEANLQIFSLADNNQVKNYQRSDNNNNLADSGKNAKNVFKIAFGSKLPSNSTPLLVPPSSSLNQLKSKKSVKSELTEQIDNNNNNTQITTDLISPLSIHSASINSANTTSRRSKSESENQLLDQLNNSIKLLEIPAINYNKLTPLTNQQQQQQRPTTTTTTIKTNNETFISNSKNLEQLNSDLLSSNKIPHPPPQSTRPVNSSARKLRLSSAVQQKNNKQQTATKQQQHQVNKITNGGESSSNEEDIQNNSSKTLIEYSPFKNKAQQNKNNSVMINENITDLMQGLKLNKNLPTTSRPKSKQLETIQHESSSNKNLVYSFSSRPKPAGLIQKKDNNNNNTSNNNNNGGLNKIYDFTKYSTNSAKSLKNSNSLNETGTFQVIQNETTNLSNKRKLTQPFRNSTNKLNDNKNVISADLYDSIDTNMKYPTTFTKTNNNNNNNETYNEVVDSFEAKMLLDMKAEMDSGVSTITKTNPKIQVNNVNNTYKTTTTITTTTNESIVNEAQEATKKNLLKPEKEKSNLNPKSPDAEYFENIRLEANGIHSPMSDDNNPTSEKYNFDAITSSIDETTTSISKKTPSRRVKGDESNNYQDEMNVSLQLNMPSKSINLKELQLNNYSPMQNHQHHTFNLLHKDAISEEPSHYDDSQADIDDIVSDSDEEVDLLYDPALNCYYDPKTSTYYELNLS